MRRWLVFLLCFFGFTLNVRAEDEWIKLFNGKDLTGWKLHPQTNKAIKDVKPVEVDGKVVAYEGVAKINGEEKSFKLWRVEDGVIIGGGPMSHLFTDRDDFADFHFKADVKVGEKGNSGVFYRAGFRGGVPKGYEAQVNATHGDRVKTGSIYPNGEFGLDKYKKETCIMDTAAHKPDEWFLYEIISKGATTQILVNSKEVMKWTDPENRFQKGHFALQAHDPGSVMYFKNIEVKILK